MNKNEFLHGDFYEHNCKKHYYVRLFVIERYGIVYNIENEIVDMCCHFTR